LSFRGLLSIDPQEPAVDFVVILAHRGNFLLSVGECPVNLKNGYLANWGFLFCMNAITPSLQSAAQEMSPAPK